jgi:hypothetical protein
MPASLCRGRGRVPPADPSLLHPTQLRGLAAAEVGGGNNAVMESARHLLLRARSEGVAGGSEHRAAWALLKEATLVEVCGGARVWWWCVGGGGEGGAAAAWQVCCPTRCL